MAEHGATETERQTDTHARLQYLRFHFANDLAEQPQILHRSHLVPEREARGDDKHKRQRDRETETERQRQRDRETERQRACSA